MSDDTEIRAVPVQHASMRVDARLADTIYIAKGRGGSNSAIIQKWMEKAVNMDYLTAQALQVCGEGEDVNTLEFISDAIVFFPLHEAEVRNLKADYDRKLKLLERLIRSTKDKELIGKMKDALKPEPDPKPEEVVG